MEYFRILINRQFILLNTFALRNSPLLVNKIKLHSIQFNNRIWTIPPNIPSFLHELKKWNLKSAPHQMTPGNTLTGAQLEF